MMQVMYPTYTLRIEIQDVPPSQNFQQSGTIDSNGKLVATPQLRRWFNASMDKIGCDEVLKEVREALSKADIRANISFEKFEHR